MGIIGWLGEKVVEGVALGTLGAVGGGILDAQEKRQERIQKKKQAALIEQRPDLIYLHLTEDFFSRNGDFRSKGKTKYTVKNAEKFVVFSAEEAWDEKRKNAVLIDGTRRKVGVMAVNVEAPRGRAQKSDQYTIVYSIAIDGKKLGKMKTAAAWSSKEYKMAVYDWTVVKIGTGQYMIKEDRDDIAQIVMGGGEQKNVVMVGVKKPEDVNLAILLSILMYTREKSQR